MTRLALSALVAVSVVMSVPHSDAEIPSIDLGSINRVSIIGDASRVVFTTIEGQPATGTLASAPSGWLKRWTPYWFAAECRTASEMSVSGSVLTVRIAPTTLQEFSGCAVSVEANLAAGTDIDIDQAATKAVLHGSFGAIQLAGKAADIEVEGHAASITSNIDQMRIRVNFTRTDNNEEITLTSKALDADLSLGAETISYRIDTIALMLDSTLANTPGARPAVSIKADYARTKMR